MKVCIIGAGNGGAVASLQISRLAGNEADISIFSNRTMLGCSPCEIPLVLSGDVATWDELIRGLRTESFYQKRNIKLFLNTEITEIVTKDKYIVAGSEKHTYDKLILDLGAIPSLPDYPGMNGENEFLLSTDMADGIKLEKAIVQNKSAAIIGGGYISLEVAASLRSRNYDAIYHLVRSTLLRSNLDADMGQIIEELVRNNGIELILGATIKNIVSRDGSKHILLSDREIDAGFIFFGTGAVPNVTIARKAGIEIGETGAIKVNKYLQTSDPDIYAVGDCMENWDAIVGAKRRHQLALNAIRTGYIAGRNLVLNNSISYKGTVMPFVTELFGHQIGSVGFTEHEAKEKGLDVASVSIDTPSLRTRFGGKPAHYKIIADRKMKTLVGAQLISAEMVSSTIDKLAVAIGAKMPLIEVVQIDSSYSPRVQEDQIAVPLQRLIDEIG
jgi:NADPH-dependent 2,4-dienoyl-CoA reductase/sulfur reductase-like enzyme